MIREVDCIAPGRREFDVNGSRYRSELAGTLLDSVYTVYRRVDGVWIRHLTLWALSHTEAVRKAVRPDHDRKYRIAYVERGTGTTQFHKTVKATDPAQASGLFYANNANRKIVKITRVAG